MNIALDNAMPCCSAYVANNPLNATDPSGEETVTTTEEVWIAAFIGVGIGINQHEEIDPETGAVVAQATSVTFRVGLGLGASLGGEVHYCGECTIDDVSSGDSFTAEVDAVLVGGELSKVETSGNDDRYARGDGELSGGVGAGPGVGFFFSLDQTSETMRVDHRTGETSFTPENLPDLSSLPDREDEPR